MEGGLCRMPSPGQASPCDHGWPWSFRCVNPGPLPRVPPVSKDRRKNPESLRRVTSTPPLPGNGKNTLPGSGRGRKGQEGPGARAQGGLGLLTARGPGSRAGERGSRSRSPLPPELDNTSFSSASLCSLGARPQACPTCQGRESDPFSCQGRGNFQTSLQDGRHGGGHPWGGYPLT